MKQRLVGAIVLGCLAIIFIPLILDGEGVSAPELGGTIPEAPALTEALLIEEERPEILADSEAVNIGQPDTASGEDRDTSMPHLNELGLPESWSVRLASFGDPANAQALLSELLDRNYKAYSEPLDTGQDELTAVFVGPVLTLDDAETLQAALAEDFALEGMIVEFSLSSDMR